jgi:transmembrane sensor
MAPDRTHEIDPTAPVSEQASSWWILLNEGEPTAADRRAFGDWVTRSPERVAAFLQAARVSQTLSSPATPWPDTSVEDLIRAAREARHDVAQLPRAQGARVAAASDRASFGSRVPLAARIAAAAVVLLLMVGIASYLNLKPQRYETAVGEQRSVVLSDGSLVTLNTATSVELRFVKDHRVVRLLAGEALFQVAHDTARPFDVTAGDTTVRAVGTQFNVDRRATGTTVTVVEGRVAVMTATDDTPNSAPSRLPLEAGEQITVSPQRAQQVVHTDVANAIAWTQRKLIFENRRLAEVAAEFNRYNRQVIDIQGEGLRDQQVTGVFQANDAGSFLEFLARTPGVSVVNSADGARYVVSQRAGRMSVPAEK